MRSPMRVFWAVVFAAAIFAALQLSLKSEDPGSVEPQPVVAERPAEPVLPSELPDFSAFQNVEDKKEAFIEFMRPFVEYQNRQLLKERQRLLNWQRVLERDGRLSVTQRKAMYDLARSYKVSVSDYSDAEIAALLLRRVDVVPVSLALSQSATESGWGTSRFAVEGNNLFGIWCYQPGCGIVPMRRGASARHEVAAFDSPLHSVKAYFRNINTHPAYRTFRDLREKMRADSAPLTGLNLVDGLASYSERGDLYIEQIKSMIRTNNLARFDA